MTIWLLQARPIDAEDAVEHPWVTYAFARSVEGAKRCLERAQKAFPKYDEFEWQMVTKSDEEYRADAQKK